MSVPLLRFLSMMVRMELMELLLPLVYLYVLLIVRLPLMVSIQKMEMFHRKTLD